MKKTDKIDKLNQLRIQKTKIENEIANLEWEIDPPLKNGFYLLTFKEFNEDISNVVIHILDGRATCLNGMFEFDMARRDSIKNSVWKWFRLFELEKDPTLKKITPTQAISFLENVK